MMGLMCVAELTWELLQTVFLDLHLNKSSLMKGINSSLKH